MALGIPAAVNLHTLALNSDPNAVHFGPLETSGSGARGGVKVSGNLPIGGTNATQMGLDNNNAGGARWLLSGTFDANTDHKVFLGVYQFNASNRMGVDTAANNGIIGRVYSGTNQIDNFREWVLGGNDTTGGKSNPGTKLYVLDPLAPGFTETGTMDESAVEAWGQGFKATTAGSAPSNVRVWAFWSRTFLFSSERNNADIPKFTGTSSFSDAVDLIQGDGDFSTKIHECATQSGDVINIFFPFQIGDGATATTFSDEGKTIVSPGHNSPGDPSYQLSTQAMRVYMVPSASDTYTLSGTYIWGTAAAWDMDASVGSTSLSNASFFGMGDTTLGPAVTGTATFALAAGAEVVLNGTDVSGTVQGDARLTAETDLTDLTITGDLYVATGLDSSLTFTGVTVGGSVFNDSPSNTLTISSNASSITAGDPGTGSGQTSILNTSTVEFTGLSDGANIRIFTGIGGTLLDEALGVTTGIAIFSVDAALGSIYYTFTDLDEKVIQGTLDVTTSRSQGLAPQLDRNYSNPA